MIDAKLAAPRFKRTNPVGVSGQPSSHAKQGMTARRDATAKLDLWNCLSERLRWTASSGRVSAAKIEHDVKS